MDLYDELKSTGVAMDNHESDLYVKGDPGIEEIIQKHGNRLWPFSNQIDGNLWFEIPFGYRPFWDKKVRK